jgi:hypothetical protein
MPNIYIQEAIVNKVSRRRISLPWSPVPTLDYSFIE